ncbi:MAG: CPBP family intramembrane metalloprotease [Methanobacteriaceae archaeon]|nr:CPBP family intramembrane metalloprotease [Methanobacteriaceae archaeon]
MNIFRDKSNFNKLFFKIIIGLIIIQLFRSVLMITSNFILKPGHDFLLFNLCKAISLLVTIILLFLYFKPSWVELSYSINNNKLLYSLGFVILLILSFIPFTFNWELDILFINLYGVFLIPFFEESIFRGFIWNKLNNQLNNEYGVLFITSVLFAFWHTGYLDVFLLNSNSGNIFNLLIFKVIFGFVLGLILGFARLKTDNIYLSFLLHGFWNLFSF